MATQIKKSTYRLRTYSMPDGSLFEIFGEGDLQVPVTGILVSDHDIDESVTVTDHILVSSGS